MKNRMIKEVLLPILLGNATVVFEIFISMRNYNIYRTIGFSMLAVIFSTVILLWIARSFSACAWFIAANCGTFTAIVAAITILIPGAVIDYNTIVLIAVNWCVVTAICILARLIDKKGRFERFNVFFMIASIIFVFFYAITLAYALFLKTPVRGSGFMYRSLNLTPFKTILPYITESHRFNFSIIVENLLGNILLFLPLGFYLQVLSVRIRLPLRILTVLSVPVFVEILQFITGIGSADIDDVILNFTGGMAGMALCMVLEAAYTKRMGKAAGKLFVLS